MENSTTFYPPQERILRMMSLVKSEEIYNELADVISNFFAKKADEELDKLWDEGLINEETIKQWGSEHMRTPYKK